MCQTFYINFLPQFSIRILYVFDLQTNTKSFKPSWAHELKKKQLRKYFVTASFFICTQFAHCFFTLGFVLNVKRDFRNFTRP